MSLILTFAVGAVCCIIAQLLIDLTALTPAKILVGYVCAGVALFALGIYEPLFEVAGCGISVPLFGFGAAMARGVKEAVAESGAIGILTGGLSATAGGITAALFLGFLLSLFFRGREKRM